MKYDPHHLTHRPGCERPKNVDSLTIYFQPDDIWAGFNNGTAVRGGKNSWLFLSALVGLVVDQSKVEK